MGITGVLYIPSCGWIIVILYVHITSPSIPILYFISVTLNISISLILHVIGSNFNSRCFFIRLGNAIFYKNQ